MKPEDALQEQIARYRKMSGEERLALALDLHVFACDLSRAGIRRQHPTASDSEVEERLRCRLRLVPNHERARPPH